MPLQASAHAWDKSIMVEGMAQSCRRASVREAVTLAGSAFGLGRSRSIIVSDLSAEGARLDARDMPAPGDDVLVVVGPFDGLARVVWRSDDKCGVEFDDALPGETLERMKSEAKWMSVAGWYR
ncbi:MAG: PilZ domain-containing protein [Sphingomicrobium sp.]